MTEQSTGALSQRGEADIVISTMRVRHILLAVVLTLIALNFAQMVAVYFYGVNPKNGLVHTFNVDEEYNVPTYFSGLFLFFSAALTWVIAKVERLRENKDYRYWFGAAAAFLYMSMDEIGTLHEHLVRPMKSAAQMSSYFHFGWVIPYAIFAIVFVVAYFRFWWRLPADTRWRLAGAAALFLSGAVGLEMIDGHFAEVWGTTKTFGYACFTAVEESLEMFAHVFFIDTFLRHWRSVRSTLTIAVANK